MNILTLFGFMAFAYIVGIAVGYWMAYTPNNVKEVE